MLTANRMSKWQAFVWLWRNDPEAKFFWFKLWLTGVHLKDAVKHNLKDFGYFPKVNKPKGLLCRLTGKTLLLLRAISL